MIMDKLETAVLELLLFPEPFSVIVEECAESNDANIVGDVLKTLIHDELVSPYEKLEDGSFKRHLGYDSDNMHAFYYQVTSKGTDVLSNR